MKRILAGMVLALSLYGCGNASDVEPSPAPAPVSENADDVYLLAIKKEYPELENLDDQMLLDVADKNCEAFDAGLSFEDIALITINSGMDPEMGGYILGAAVGTQCPEHLDQIPN